MPYHLRSMAETPETPDQIQAIYDYMDKKFNDLEKKISGQFIDDIKSKISKEFQTILKNQEEKIIKLESTVALLQQHVTTLKQQNFSVSKSCEELEQYGRRVCLRIDGFQTEKDEKPNDVLEKVKSVWSEAGIDIPDAVIDRAHRIGPTYKDHVTKVEMKSVIVRFTTFRHRTILYNARKIIKEKFKLKVKLDLTRHRYKLLQDAIAYVLNVKERVKFVYCDVNCRLRVKFVDESDKTFESMEDLEKVISDYDA